MKSHQLINQTSGIVEYGSPEHIVEAARRLMGRIDLDPASSAKWNALIRAEEYFNKFDDGLLRPWHGRVWLNHPFGAYEVACKTGKNGAWNCTKKICAKRGFHLHNVNPGNAAWVNKIELEYNERRMTEGCCICFASTSEAWFRPLLFRPQCFLSPRANYIGSDGKPLEGVSKGSVVTYYGQDVRRFAEIFNAFGVVKIPLLAA